MSERAYLDWNATAPLRPQAREAMVDAMAVLGNPSSVHAEGRTAKGILEAAREQVAVAVGAHPRNVVFTSGGSESNALALSRAIEHAGRSCDVAIASDGLLWYLRPILDAHGLEHVKAYANDARFEDGRFTPRFGSPASTSRWNRPISRRGRKAISSGCRRPPVPSSCSYRSMLRISGCICRR